MCFFYLDKKKYMTNPSSGGLHNYSDIIDIQLSGNRRRKKLTKIALLHFFIIYRSGS
jgi:hypothetical protein